MIRWIFGLGAVCVLATAAPCFADTAPGSPSDNRHVLDSEQLELGDLFRIAEQYSPRLASARSAVRAQSGSARQAGLYPNPELEFEVEDMDTDDFGLRRDKIALALPVVFSGRLGNAADEARSLTEAVEQNLRETRRSVFRRIHGLWAEVLYLREVRAALRDLREDAGRTLTIAETRFQAQAAPESQVSKAGLEAAELELLSVGLEQREATVRVALAAALGLDHIDLESISGSLEAGIAPSLSLGDISAHPAVSAARSHVHAAQAAERLARSQRLPDLRLFAAYGRPRPEGASFLEAGISLPLPLFDRNQGRVAETRARVRQAESELRTAESHLGLRWAEAQGARRTLQQEWEISRDRLLPAAARSLDQAREGYRLGRVPLLELLDAQRTFSRLRLRSIELNRDLILAEADLLALAGSGHYSTTGDLP